MQECVLILIGVITTLLPIVSNTGRFGLLLPRRSGPIRPFSSAFCCGPRRVRRSGGVYVAAPGHLARRTVRVCRYGTPLGSRFRLIRAEWIGRQRIAGSLIGPRPRPPAERAVFA